MNADGITLTVVASIFGLVATILTILTFFNNRKKDSVKDSREIAAMQTDLIYIKDGIGELKTMAKAQSKEQTAMGLKLQQIEDKCCSLDNRISIIESKSSKGGN